MWMRRLVLAVAAMFFVLVAGYAALLFIPVQGRFTLADYEQIKMGMAVEEVEAILGPQVPEAQNVLTNASTDPPPCWKAWGDETEQLHVLFDASGRVERWVVHPLRPRLIDHVRPWLGR